AAEPAGLFVLNVFVAGGGAVATFGDGDDDLTAAASMDDVACVGLCLRGWSSGAAEAEDAAAATCVAAAAKAAARLASAASLDCGSVRVAFAAFGVAGSAVAGVAWSTKIDVLSVAETEVASAGV